MNNPELICALCDQIKEESEALQRTTANERSTITNETREIFDEIKISHVVHMQKLVIALTREMTPDESEEFDKQMEDSELPETTEEV